MTTVTDRVSATGHNCHDTDTGNFPGFGNAGAIWWGNDSVDGMWTGLIWDGVNIPDGATIDAGCSFQITDVEFGFGQDITMRVYAEETVSLTVFATGDSPADRVNRTTASVNQTFNLASTATGTSDEINTIIQEVIDDTSGQLNDLTLHCDDEASAGGEVIRDFEGFGSTSAEAAFVTIEYTAAGGGADPEGPLVGGKLVGRGILGGRLVA